MTGRQSVTWLRVRYSETDQMGTFYNSRVLEWFECGRTDFLRMIHLPYAQMEERGVFLPIIEAHIEYRGRARYDDQLRVTTTAALSAHARLRFDVSISHAEHDAPVARGYTVHAFTDSSGRPHRPPEWLIDALNDDRS
ncbi:MAG: acyl-CoA thioesterase [Phycisphaerales bacterium]|nr:MAG: acyl-CoA thioesterase [Phycisphaerales bacterium]